MKKSSCQLDKCSPTGKVMLLILSKKIEYKIKDRIDLYTLYINPTSKKLRTFIENIFSSGGKKTFTNNVSNGLIHNMYIPWLPIAS